MLFAVCWLLLFVDGRLTLFVVLCAVLLVVCGLLLVG